jgi:hypothetical protein
MLLGRGNCAEWRGFPPPLVSDRRQPAGQSSESLLKIGGSSDTEHVKAPAPRGHTNHRCRGGRVIKWAYIYE